MQNISRPPSPQLLTQPQVLELVPYTAVHISRLEKSGDFPQRVRIGKNRIAWVADEIHQWVESKISARPLPPRKKIQDGCP